MLKQPDTLYDFGLTGGEKPGDDYKFCALVGKSQNSVVTHDTICNMAGSGFDY